MVGQEAEAGAEPELELVRVSDHGALMVSDVSSVALDFKVLHPVVVTRLGVFPAGPAYLLPANVTVKLYQLDQEVRPPHSPNQTPTLTPISGTTTSVLKAELLKVELRLRFMQMRWGSCGCLAVRLDKHFDGLPSAHVAQQQ